MTNAFKKRLKIRFSLILLLGLISFNPALVQAKERWYTVEVLVFKRLGNAAYSDEVWRNDVTLEYPGKRQWLHNGSGSSNAFKLLPITSHQLGGHNYTLRRNEDYKVLFHRAWLQPVTDVKKAPAIIIRGGEDYGQHRELEGSITLSVSRYLHLHTNLWLTKFTGGGNNQSQLWPPLPSANPNDDIALSSNSDIERIVTMKQKRRMRSKELHYIDHPQMGLLVMITPLEG